MMHPQHLVIQSNLYVLAKDQPVAKGDEVSRLKLQILPLLLYRGKRKVKYQDANWNWLDGLTPSEAFIYSIAEGPWKENQVEKVRKRMLNIVGKRDLGALSPAEIENMAIPLKWQKDRLVSIVKYLIGTGQSFSDFARNLHGLPPTKAMALFYKAVGVKTRTKTIDLFARDFLKIDCIPIDRHVRRVLKHFGLPEDEQALIKLSFRAGIKPRFLARLLLSFAFTGAPFASPVKKGM